MGFGIWFGRSVCFASLALVMTGCHAAKSDLPVASVADSAVIVDPPLVKVELFDNQLTVSGTVHRQPSVGGTITGRVDVDFIGADGEVINQDVIGVALNPPRIPTDPHAVSSYVLYYAPAPPKGTTVRVQFIDSQAAANEDADGKNNFGTTNAGVHHAGGGGIHSGSVGHNW